MKINFADNLKRLRISRGYSRAALAERLAYSVKSVEKWELGNVLPPMAVVCRLSEIFQVTVDQLLYRDHVNIRYLLGVDGGGTKTEFLLTDRERREVKRLVLGPSNPVDVGMASCKAILEEGILRVCEGISLREVSAFMGLAGGMTGNNCEIIGDFLSGFCFGACQNGGDVETALELACGDEDGAVVIIGTGVVAYAQTKGKRCRVGGWGYLIDQGGSGFNFGAQAIDSALKNVDGRGGSRQIREWIERQIGQPIDQSISDIYKKGKSYVASFAPAVFEAYRQGDDCARQIVERNVKELAAIIRVVQTDKPVVLCGGLCAYADILQAFLPQESDVIFMGASMVEGAVALARKNAED